ncbi:unnamed protein product, partial [Didymodactylos carnosus]
ITNIHQLFQKFDKNNGRLIAKTDIRKLILTLKQEETEKLKNTELFNDCLENCCWSISSRPTSYSSVLSRISQIDMKLIADLHYGTLPIPDFVQLPEFTLDILPCMRNGTVLFVDSTSVAHFLRDIHPQIQVDYILMTGDSDLSMPHYSISTTLTHDIFHGKTHIRHWFAMNCNKNEWSKYFSCIPQGISQWANQRYYVQMASGKNDSFFNTYLKLNDYWLLTSFNVAMNPQIRQSVWNLTCYGRLKSISKCHFEKDMNLWSLYVHIARSKFVISPPGKGLDCHRTWETLYLGSIPIVLSTTIDSLFQRLPVVIVKNYEQITLEFLQKTYENMFKQKFDYSRLYKQYWQQRIDNYRSGNMKNLQIKYHLKAKVTTWI